MQANPIMGKQQQPLRQRARGLSSSVGAAAKRAASNVATSVSELRTPKRIEAPARVTHAHFERDDCLNCGATLTGAFCSACGQKKATRIGGSTVRTEAWNRFRWFEFEGLKSAFALIRSPGGFARDYVLGKRVANMHPLALLLLMVGALVVLLGYTQYLTPTIQNEIAAKMFALVREYSKWSFSLGIIAIYGSAMIVFRKRLGYNATEILALSIYCHAVCIAWQIANQLPLLIWDSAPVLQWHKRISPWSMGALQTVIIVLAFRSFFCVNRWREAWKLVLAGALFVGIKWGVQQGYARLVAEVVYWQLGLND